MKRVILVCAIFFYNNAIAFVWGNNTTITGLYVYSNGSAYLRTANNENPDGCSSSSYLVLDVNSKHFKYLYATALAAHLSGSTVTLNYDGCSGENQYPVINSIAVPQIW